MINQITVTNHLSESLTLSLSDPYSTGLVVESITGLGPPKASINTSDLAMGDGAVYNSGRVDKRNIVMRLRLLEVWEDNEVTETIEDVRLKTYKYFPLNKPITLTIETENRTVWTEGYVESNDPDVFSKDETASISIICPRPFFYGAEVTETTFPITYDGEYDCGVLLDIMCSGPVNTPVIRNVTNDDSITINRTFKNTDHILISSVLGDTYINFTTYGDPTPVNLMNYVPKLDSWVHLTRGTNNITASATSGANKLSVSVKYTPLYGGV